MLFGSTGPCHHQNPQRRQLYQPPLQTLSRRHHRRRHMRWTPALERRSRNVRPSGSRGMGQASRRRNCCRLCFQLSPDSMLATALEGKRCRLLSASLMLPRTGADASAGSVAGGPGRSSSQTAAPPSTSAKGAAATSEALSAAGPGADAVNKGATVAKAGVAEAGSVAPAAASAAPPAVEGGGAAPPKRSAKWLARHGSGEPPPASLGVSSALVFVDRAGVGCCPRAATRLRAPCTRD